MAGTRDARHRGTNQVTTVLMLSHRCALSSRECNDGEIRESCVHRGKGVENQKTDGKPERGITVGKEEGNEVGKGAVQGFISYPPAALSMRRN